jgi:hypothetical protein
MSVNCGHQRVCCSFPDGTWVWIATVEWYWQGNTEELGEKKTCHSATFLPHPTWTDLGANLGLRGENTKVNSIIYSKECAHIRRQCGSDMGFWTNTVTLELLNDMTWHVPSRLNFEPLKLTSEITVQSRWPHLLHSVHWADCSPYYFETENRRKICIRRHHHYHRRCWQEWNFQTQTPESLDETWAVAHFRISQGPVLGTLRSEDVVAIL